MVAVIILMVVLKRRENKNLENSNPISVLDLDGLENITLDYLNSIQENDFNNLKLLEMFPLLEKLKEVDEKINWIKYWLDKNKDNKVCNWPLDAEVDKSCGLDQYCVNADREFGGQCVSKENYNERFHDKFDQFSNGEPHKTNLEKLEIIKYKLERVLGLNNNMKGWLNKYSQRGLNHKTEDGIDGCREKAKKLGVKGFTYRTNKHPTEWVKNTCVFYEDDDLSDWETYWSRDKIGAHISACTDENYKWPCNNQ